MTFCSSNFSYFSSRSFSSSLRFPTDVNVFSLLLSSFLFHSLSPSSTFLPHLLDLIEFFPEEEMFPPNESVEILHSDKHDPIFRLIKESFSLRRPFISFSRLFRNLHRAEGQSLTLAAETFDFRSSIDRVYTFPHSCISSSLNSSLLFS